METSIVPIQRTVSAALGDVAAEAIVARHSGPSSASTGSATPCVMVCNGVTSAAQDKKGSGAPSNKRPVFDNGKQRDCFTKDHLADLHSRAITTSHCRSRMEVLTVHRRPISAQGWLRCS